MMMGCTASIRLAPKPALLTTTARADLLAACPSIRIDAGGAPAAAFYLRTRVTRARTAPLPEPSPALGVSRKRRLASTTGTTSGPPLEGRTRAAAANLASGASHATDGKPPAQGRNARPRAQAAMIRSGYTRASRGNRRRNASSQLRRSVLNTPSATARRRYRAGVGPREH